MFSILCQASYGEYPGPDPTGRDQQPSPTTLDQRGQRKPSIFAPRDASGIDAEPLTWPQQWRLLLTIRTNAGFRRELRDALGVR